jgi:hypothetical protein
MEHNNINVTVSTDPTNPIVLVYKTDHGKHIIRLNKENAETLKRALDRAINFMEEDN